MPKAIHYNRQHEYEVIENLQNNDWKVLCNSSEFPDVNQNGYKAVTFINLKMKQLLIATAGTVPLDIYDLKDDAYIAAGSFPSKVVQAKSMIDKVCKLLGTDISHYTFNVTGHSLGAVLADVSAFEIISRGLKLGTSVTFDSPGSKNAINQAIQAGVFSKTTDVTVEDLAEHCIIYNSKHNFINYNPVINCPHVTAPKLVLPVKQSSTEVSVQSEPAGIFGYVKYLVGKLGSNVVKYCSDYLGVTGALNVLENLKGHSLKNFAELCEKPVVNTEDWNKTLDGTLVIKDFERSDHITSTGNDVVIFKEKNIENDIISISASGFSYDDLRRAHHYDTNEISLSGNNNEFLDFEYVN